MGHYSGFLGIAAILGLALFFSENRQRISLRLVLYGLSLQVGFAFFILKTPIGQPFFDFFDRAIRQVLEFADQGARFVFKSFASGEMEAPLVNIAFSVLPTLIFFSALMSVLYHLGVMQWVIGWIAKLMQKTLKTSGAETLSVAANIFIGQTEAPLLIRPFLADMTRSELMAVMTGGFATIAGGVMAIYVAMLSHIPGIAGHLMAASIMNAPAALVIAKMICPESAQSTTSGAIPVSPESPHVNLLEAVTVGAADGLKLALNVAAMLIAFVALVALLNALLGLIGLDLQSLLGYLFRPLAWLMGVSWQEAGIVGGLLGQKMVLTEMLAYANLAEIIKAKPDALSAHSQIIATYALCGFANFASIGVQIGGTGSLVPERQKDLAQLGMKAMLAATLANCLSGTVAGLLL